MADLVAYAAIPVGAQFKFAAERHLLPTYTKISDKECLSSLGSLEPVLTVFQYVEVLHAPPSHRI